MTKVVPYETDNGVRITEFKRSTKGKKEKVVKKEDWGGDPKKLRQEADKE